MAEPYSPIAALAEANRTIAAQRNVIEALKAVIEHVDDEGKVSMAYIIRYWLALETLTKGHHA